MSCDLRLQHPFDARLANTFFSVLLGFLVSFPTFILRGQIVNSLSIQELSNNIRRFQMSNRPHVSMQDNQQKRSFFFQLTIQLLDQSPTSSTNDLQTFDEYR